MNKLYLYIGLTVLIVGGLIVLLTRQPSSPAMTPPETMMKEEPTSTNSMMKEEPTITDTMMKEETDSQ